MKTIQFNSGQLISSFLRDFCFNIDVKEMFDVCWGDNLHMQNHLREKFEGLLEGERKGYATADVVVKFFCELDSGNSARLEEYILNKYVKQPVE